MLANVVNALEPVAPLEHVHAIHGSKYYGHQLGPVRMPMREDDPRAPGANFYFVQEDFLREASRGTKWTFTTTRPHAFCDPAIDHPRSLGLVLAVYATIQRELGLPLDFPGTPKAYELRTQFTDLGLLARAILWMATEPRCANQAFNVVNGDNPRWSELWARLAQWFGLRAGAARSMRLVEYVADKAPVWDAIVAKHGLRPTQLDQLALWAYGDYQFSPQWDVHSDISKARALGFHEAMDSGEMFFRQFEHYREEKIIP
jgi:nucleoside-diphosphate-sugar epimerase